MPEISARSLLYALIVITAIAAIALLLTQNPNALLVEGVLIDAGQGSPYTAFSELSNSNSFIISPQMYEPTVVLDQYMFNGAALFIQVLEGNRKGVEQVFRVYSPDNEMLYCVTNRGDLSIQETISVEECNLLLQSEDRAIILIQFPDNSLPRPELKLAPGRLTAKPKSYSDIGSTCFLALRIMYENAQAVVEASNLLVEEINL